MFAFSCVGGKGIVASVMDETGDVLDATSLAARSVIDTDAGIPVVFARPMADHTCAARLLLGRPDYWSRRGGDSGRPLHMHYT